MTGKAGTAVIFTEALTHSALPWHGAGERRTLFYKYHRSASAWFEADRDRSQFANLSKRQQEILMPPISAHEKGKLRSKDNGNTNDE